MSELFVRLEVGWLDHPDLIILGPEGRGVHTIALVLAKRLETDGWISRAQMYREGASPEMVDKLIEAGLLEAPDGDMVRPSGWHDRNPSQDAIDATRIAKKRGGASGNHKRWKHKGPFGACSICHPALAEPVAPTPDEAEKPQVVASCESHPLAPPSHSDRTPLAPPSPETETETETYNPPPDSQSDPPPDPTEPTAAVVDDQQIRRTAALVGKALAVGADNPAAYAAAATKRILTGDDPTDRDEITRALTEGLTPEAIAENWDPGPPDPLAAITGPRTPRTTAPAAPNPIPTPEQRARNQARAEALADLPQRVSLTHRHPHPHPRPSGDP